MSMVINLTILFMVLFLFHRSFRGVPFLGFLISFLIGVGAHACMISILHMQSLQALLIVIILSPTVEILLRRTSIGLKHHESIHYQPMPPIPDPRGYVPLSFQQEPEQIGPEDFTP